MTTINNHVGLLIPIAVTLIFGWALWADYQHSKKPPISWAGLWLLINPGLAIAAVWALWFLMR